MQSKQQRSALLTQQQSGAATLVFLKPKHSGYSKTSSIAPANHTRHASDTFKWI